MRPARRYRASPSAWGAFPVEGIFQQGQSKMVASLKLTQSKKGDEDD
jgi:hypothetical protein